MSDTEKSNETYASAFPVALVGVDYPGLRIRIDAPEGTRVRIGQTLFRDRKNPDIAFVSPIRGIVSSVTYAPRRMLGAFVIDPDDAAPAEPVRIEPDGTSADGARQTLLDGGMWPAFVTRPFGGLPNPDARPDAIFVTATPASANGPDPQSALEGRAAEFAEGLRVLTLLTDGTVHLCQTADQPLIANPPDRVRIARFSNGPGSGLAGTHVHRLHPVDERRQVWTIGYQDVIAVGCLFTKGHYDPLRCVAVYGPGGARHDVVRLPLGVSLQRAVASRFAERPNDRRILSGPEPLGREAAYLGRHHDEIAVTDHKTSARAPTDRSPRPLFALAQLERILPLNILPVPMMRALRIEDTETARRLGCLELLEDDVAVLSAQCTSGANYGRHLRAVLDDLRKQIA